jgi:ribosomal protein S12 methylthiotransferase accessory factor YcaO
MGGVFTALEASASLLIDCNLSSLRPKTLWSSHITDLSLPLANETIAAAARSQLNGGYFEAIAAEHNFLVAVNPSLTERQSAISRPVGHEGDRLRRLTSF